MPLFAYICKQCGVQSELLARAGEKVACPACGSKKMEQQMSHFATLSSRAPEPACTGCAMAEGGQCPSNQQARCMP